MQQLTREKGEPKKILNLVIFKILIKPIRLINLPDGLEDGNIHLEKEPSCVKY